MDLTGRTVAITGGASGIGAALAVEAAARGARSIAIIDVDLDGAVRQCDELFDSGVDARAFRCDVSDADSVERVAGEVVDALGIPGLVCAIAGTLPKATKVLNIDPADFAWVLSVNVVGVWATCRSFGRHMSATSEPGWFLVAGSEHSLGVPHLGQGAYTASKHAVLGVCDVMRRELPSHLGVSVMFPGLVATNLWLAPTRAPHAASSPDADTDFTRAVQARGMDPRVLAVRALEGVEDGRFIIATHNHVLDLAAARWHEIEEAFATAALDVDDPVYAVESVAAEVMAERGRLGS